MTTILRQRSNYLWNPRGQAESGVYEDRRRNRYPNPRQVSTGTAPTAHTAGTPGTVTRSWATGIANPELFPAGITTARRHAIVGLGPAATDRVGEYVDLPAAPGEVVTVSAYARRTAGASNTKAARLTVEWRSATAALAAAGTASATLSGALSSDGKVYPRRLTVPAPAAPAGTTTLRVYLWVEGAAAGTTGTQNDVTAEWTGILVEDGPTVRPYFDGATPAELDATNSPTTFCYWTGTAHASASVLSSPDVEARDATGKTVKARQPTGWQPAAADSLAARASWYRWRDGADDVVRLQPFEPGPTAGPTLYPDNDASKAATFPGTLLIEARREVAGSAVALTVTHNGAAVAGVPALGDTYTTLRVPLTLVGAAGVDSANVLRIGKTGADPVLIRAVALVDEANYAGPYFDGSTPTVGLLDSVWTEPSEAPNSSSYQGIPSLSVTAAAEPAGTNYPPRVRLEVADVDELTPALAVTLLRVDSSGRRTPVRSATGGPVELPVAAVGRAVVLYDYEAPLGAGSSYVIGDAELPSIPSARVTPDDARPWLIHPGVPARSRPLSVVRLGKRRRRVVEGVYDVVGRPDPITRTDGRRKSAESELVVRTYTDAEREALDLLLDDATALLLSIPPARGWGLTYEWVAIGDSDEDRTADTGTWPRRLWTLPYRVVGRPIGGTRAARTWHDVAAEAASWRKLAEGLPESRRKWSEVADPTAPGA